MAGSGCGMVSWIHYPESIDQTVDLYYELRPENCFALHPWLTLHGNGGSRLKSICKLVEQCQASPHCTVWHKCSCHTLPTLILLTVSYSWLPLLERIPLLLLQITRTHLYIILCIIVMTKWRFISSTKNRTIMTTKQNQAIWLIHFFIHVSCLREWPTKCFHVSLSCHWFVMASLLGSSGSLICSDYYQSENLIYTNTEYQSPSPSLCTQWVLAPRGRI